MDNETIDLESMEQYCKEDVLLSESLFESAGFAFTSSPKPVGWMIIGDAYFSATKKPCLLHRKMLLWIFGIKWEDINE